MGNIRCLLLVGGAVPSAVNNAEFAANSRATRRRSMIILSSGCFDYVQLRHKCICSDSLTKLQTVQLRYVVMYGSAVLLSRICCTHRRFLRSGAVQEQQLVTAKHYMLSSWHPAPVLPHTASQRCCRGCDGCTVIVRQGRNTLHSLHVNACLSAEVPFNDAPLHPPLDHCGIAHRNPSSKQLYCYHMSLASHP